MKLLELQRTMARAVMQPLTFSERMQRTAPNGQSMRVYASKFIKPQTPPPSTHTPTPPT